MMRSWFKAHGQRKQVRQDRKYLEARARRILKGYLAADDPRKQRYYEAVAGAAIGCQPAAVDLALENPQLAYDTAESGLNIVKPRELQQLDGDEVQSMITDAYAAVAIAYRRAAAFYTDDKEMLRLGTAAVHLVTIATSYMEKVAPPSGPA
jgi:hypothetical protein